MRISVIVTYLTHDQMIRVQVLCPHTGELRVVPYPGDRGRYMVLDPNPVKKAP